VIYFYAGKKNKIKASASFFFKTKQVVVCKKRKGSGRMRTYFQYNKRLFFSIF